MRAVQSSSAVPAVPVSASSRSSSVTVDRDAPAAPVVTSPTAGQRVAALPLAVSGTGEAGALATVYVDSTPVCQATVSGGGTWSCSAGGSELADGDRLVQAALVDPAGQLRPAERRRARSRWALRRPPRPRRAPRRRRDPVRRRRPLPLRCRPSTAPPGTVRRRVDDRASSDGTRRRGRRRHGPPAPARDTQTGTWATATTFGADLPTLAQTLGGPVWPLGAAVGAAVPRPRRGAVPARGGRRPRPAPPSRSPSDRSQPRRPSCPPRSTGGTVDPRVAAGLALAAGAAAIAVAAGVDGQVQYARLLAGIVLGLVVLNGLVVVLPRCSSPGASASPSRVRMSPGLLLAAVVACGATRLFSLDPALVLGVLLVGTLGAVHHHGGHAVGAGRSPGRTRPRHRRGGRSSPRPSSSPLRPGCCTASSTHRAPGRSSAARPSPRSASPASARWSSSCCRSARCRDGTCGRWSKAVYAVLAVVGVSVAAAVFVGAPSSSFPLPALLVVSLVAALLAVAAWLWATYVEPARRTL